MAELESFSMVFGPNYSNKFMHNMRLKSSLNVAYKQYSAFTTVHQMDIVPHVELDFAQGISIFAQFAYQYREENLRAYKHGLHADIGLSYNINLY